MSGGHRGSVIGALGRLFESGTVADLGEAQLLERFLARGDESAFEAILERHGPMVLGVCRRVLDDPHDVADAFQATFLILVKKARSIRDRDALGTWLYGVARRVAVRARVNARRRGARERQGLDLEGRDVGNDPGHPRPDGLEIQELRATIDDELDRLPSRYRAPIILCDLEGRTHEQAAAQLGCPVGTVKSRLARGRDRLRSRLARRGLAPSAALLAATLAGESAQAVPFELMKLTLGAATRLAAGQAIAAGASSAGAAALTKGVLRSMWITRLTIATAALTTAALITTGARALIAPATPDPQQAATPAPAATTPPADPSPPEPGVERFRLANGLKVLLRPIKGTKATALVVVYDIGEDHDPEGRSGLAQMIENLYLTSAAGDEKPGTVEDPRRRYREGWSAQTGARYTAVSGVFPNGRLDHELADAAARMGGPRVTAADLDRERTQWLRVVAAMFEEPTSTAAINKAREKLRPAPAGGRHGGRPEHLRAIKLEEVRGRLDRYYKPRNAIVSLAGDFDPVAARRAIERQFAGIPAGEPIPPPGQPGAPSYDVPVATEPIPEITTPGLPMACLAYLAPGPDSDLYAPFLVLVARLWAAEAPLSSGQDASHIFFTPLDDGTVVAIALPIRRGDVPAQLFERIESFVSGAMAPKLGTYELATAKRRLGMILSLRGLPDALHPYGVAFSLARREQLGIDPAALIRRIDALTDADLKRAAAAIFDPGRHAGAIAGLSPARP